jgi:hypothetical protein
MRGCLWQVNFALAAAVKPLVKRTRCYVKMCGSSGVFDTQESLSGGVAHVAHIAHVAHVAVAALHTTICFGVNDVAGTPAGVFPVSEVQG